MEEENQKCGELPANTTETFNLSTVFSDVDAGDVLNYEILPDGIVRNVETSKPDFVELNGSVLTFTFTSSSNYEGLYSLGIKATDKSGQSVTSVIILIVGTTGSSNEESSGLIVMTSCPMEADAGSTTRSKSAKVVSMYVKLGGFAISTKGKIILSLKKWRILQQI